MCVSDAHQVYPVWISFENNLTLQGEQAVRAIPATFQTRGISLC